MIHSEMTVRDVALQMPESTRLFERLKIDYCCGGNQPLTQACASAGLDIDTLVKILNETSNTQDSSTLDFQNTSITDLITHILDTHHVFTKSEMDRLEMLVAKVIAAHGSNHPEVNRAWRALATSVRRSEASHVQGRTDTLPLHRSDDTRSRSAPGPLLLLRSGR